MPTPITRFLRHFVRAAAMIAAFFLGLAPARLAAALAFLWGGPLAVLAVYFFVVVAFIGVLGYLTE